MEIPHRRHESEATAFLPPPACQPLHGRDGGNDLHGGKSAVNPPPSQTIYPELPGGRSGKGDQSPGWIGCHPIDKGVAGDNMSVIVAGVVQW